MAKRQKKDKGGAPAPSMGEDELSDGQLYSRTEDKRQEYERCLAAKKRADAEFKNCCKSITKLLGDGAIDDIKELIAGETPEGEAKLKASVERRLRVLRWMETPIGFHGELFPMVDAAPITERSFNSGRRDALAGQSRNNQHHHTTEAHKSYEAGYDIGQAEKIATGIKPLDPDEAGDIKKSAALGSSRPSFQVQ